MKTHKRLWAPAAFVAILTLFGLPQTAVATINFVQGLGSTDDPPSSAISQAFTPANTTGNLIVVAVSWGDNTAPSHSRD